MKKGNLICLAAALLVALAAHNARAHCEIPCGIYNDQMRIGMIEEHITTIEKAMNQIMKIEGTKPGNPNQLVRWVMTKEFHSDEIQKIVTQYYMTQRIKPGMQDYEKKLTILHKMLISAMKCKQTTDPVNVKQLKAQLKDFKGLYFMK
ncbi:MAG: superoxide dismutase [Desulfobacteraceae bacterium]|nr:superoxide dismutase [Desulfobacteraceae bacterium]